MYTQELLDLNETQFSNFTLNYTQLQEQHVFEYSIIQKIIFSLFMFPIMFFSVTGNILVIIAITRCESLRKINNTFLASLAVADCAVGILAMTPNAIQLLSGKWYFKSFFCRFWFSSDVLFSTASILHLCCIAIDRYLSVSDAYVFVYKAEDPVRSWRVRLMIGGCWVISALLSFIPIFTGIYTTKEQIEIINNLNYKNEHCAFKVNLPYRFISSFISFWLPCIALVIFYSLVMKKAYEIEKRYNSYAMSLKRNKKNSKPEIAKDYESNTNLNSVTCGEKDQFINSNNQNRVGKSRETKIKKKMSTEDSSSNEPCNSNAVEPRSSNAVEPRSSNAVEPRSSNAVEPRTSNLSRTNSLARGQESVKRWNSEYRLIRTLGLVIFVFVLCWIFFFLRYTLCGTTYNVCSDFLANNLVVEDVLFWIGYFNSMVNPFLYNFTNQEFRREFAKILGLGRGRRYRFESNASNYLSRKTTIDEPNLIPIHLAQNV